MLMLKNKPRLSFVCEDLEKEGCKFVLKDRRQMKDLLILFDVVFTRLVSCLVQCLLL